MHLLPALRRWHKAKPFRANRRAAVNYAVLTHLGALMNYAVGMEYTASANGCAWIDNRVGVNTDAIANFCAAVNHCIRANCNFIA